MLKGYFQKGVIEAGCDEAGRGCLAGPVYAAAVVLPPRFSHPLLNDSKQLNAAQRAELRPIIEKKALAFAVASADVVTIDRINILQAAIHAMHLAVDELHLRPELLLIDGNRFKPYMGIPHHCIVKGDGLYRSIAAASILAKTYRDEHMARLHTEFPQYSWNENKGYATPQHQQLLREHGPCAHHRRSFRLDYPIRISEPAAPSPVAAGH